MLGVKPDRLCSSQKKKKGENYEKKICFSDLRNVRRDDGMFVACEGNTDNPDKPSYSVSFEVSEMTIEKGETKSVGITFAGGDMVDVKVEPADVASYANGKLTGLKAGTATVTASIGDKSATMTLTVTEKPAEMVNVTIGDKTESVAVGSLLRKPPIPKRMPRSKKNIPSTAGTTATSSGTLPRIPFREL